MTRPITSLATRLTRWAEELLDLGCAQARHNAGAAAASITAERAEQERAAAAPRSPGAPRGASSRGADAAPDLDR